MIKTAKPLAYWLFMCAIAVFLMTLLGAVTRLTESGLSLVEWKPVTGALPPLNAADWSREFSLYQTSPQGRLTNAGMSLDDFKQIYFWEWLHRLFGRLIGIMYFIPLAYFWMKKRIPDEAKKPLLGILALGFLQGGMGWFMVKSGLVDQPAVSHYRLAAHLALGVILFCALLRMGLLFGVKRDPGAAKLSSMRGLLKGTVALAAVTMVWGAFVAGLRAGVIYNDNFPFMGTHLWPGEMFHFSPWWRNFFENHAAVQFTHRVLAVLVFIKVFFVVWKSTTFACPERLSRLFSALLIVMCVQLGLGITTLLTHVNVVVATLHQAGALTMLALLMALLHEIPAKKAAQNAV